MKVAIAGAGKVGKSIARELARPAAHAALVAAAEPPAAAEALGPVDPVPRAEPAPLVP